MFMTVKQASEKWGISDRRERTEKDEDGRFLRMQGNLPTVVSNQRKVFWHKSTVKKLSWTAEDL